LNGTSLIPIDYRPPLEPDTCPSEEDVRKELLAFYFDRRLATSARVKRTHEYTVRNHEFARARRRAIGSTPEEWNQNLVYRGKHISEYAGELRMPVLLTWSRENRGASPADALAFYGRISDVEMHVFANAGHHVMTEHPERWSSVVTDFLLSER
jgi:pimeloyl-ACP methyl ester carboxylesterase